MKFKAEIDIMPHKELLDPQGKTVRKNMSHVHIDGIDDVRIGKHIEIMLEANDASDAENKIEQACKNILANVIMESYSYVVKAAE